MYKEIYAIVGPSGVGKDTVAEKVMASNPNLKLVVSLTTRDMRGEEVDGEDYHFVSVDNFKKAIEAGAFVEYCEVHGNYYGTMKSDINDIIHYGDIPLLIIDVEGFDKFKAAFPETQGIFIDPPSLDVLESRLRARGTEDEHVIFKRMNQAKVEIEKSKNQPYSLHVVNDNLDDCVSEVTSFIKE